MNSDNALQRLQASRASIDAELRKLHGFTDDAPPTPGASASPPWSAAAAPWLSTVTRALRLWWRRHPARVVVDIAADAGAQAITPLVRMHPLTSVLLAMAAGAAMVVWRPWRSRLSAAVWAGLSAQLTAGLVRAVLNPGTLATLLANLAQRPTAPSSTPSSTPITPPTTS